MSSVSALRALIEQKFPDATPVVRRIAQPVASGITKLDRALPHGGFPLGKLSVCAPNGGVTTMLRATCLSTVAAGDRAAWVDGARTIAGTFWEHGPLLVRPECHTRAIRAADELLRSGGFRLVVLSGITPTTTETMRLVRAASDGGGAFISVTPNANMAALRLSSRIEEYRWRFDPFGEPAEIEEVRVHVHTRALGWDKHSLFSLPVLPHELRLSLETGLADRRGLLASKRVKHTPAIEQRAEHNTEQYAEQRAQQHAEENARRQRIINTARNDTRNNARNDSRSEATSKHTRTSFSEYNSSAFNARNIERRKQRPNRIAVG